MASDTSLPCLPPLFPAPLVAQSQEKHSSLTGSPWRDGAWNREISLHVQVSVLTGMKGRKWAMNVQVKERERGRKEGKESLLPSQLPLPLTLVSACDAINLCQMAELSSNVYVYECVRACV